MKEKNLKILRNVFKITEKIIVPVMVTMIFIIMIFQFYQIKTLQSVIANLINEVDISVENCNNSLYDFSYSLENVLMEQKMQNSIISNVDYKYGKLKEDNRTAEVIISVTPKTHTEDTMVSVKIGDKSINAERTDESTFTAIYEADIFNDESYENITVTVTSNGVSKTEVVEEFSFNGEVTEEYMDLTSLYYQYLPIIDFYDETDTSVFYEKLVKVQGTIHNSSSIKIENARMVVEINGKVYEEETIDLSKEETTIDKKYKVEVTDVVIIYFIYEDTKYGYVYKQPIRYREYDINEMPCVDFVYNKDGKLLNAETDNLDSYYRN